MLADHTYRQPVCDYRTEHTGIQPRDLAGGTVELCCTRTARVLTSCPTPAPEFSQVQFQVSMILRDKIVVGHSLWHFFSVSPNSSRLSCAAQRLRSPAQVMQLSHPAIDTRDTALFLPFRKTLKFKPHVVVPLSTLVEKLMNRRIGLMGEQAVSS